MWCEEFSPETFLEQTAQTFKAALRGRRKADKYRVERETLLAYQTGAFAGLAINGKLKSFRHYSSQTEGGEKRSTALHFFHSLRARGFPVSIQRIERPN